MINEQQTLSTLPSPMHLELYHADPGSCRIYYRLGKRLYCLQEEEKGIFAFYRCTDCDWEEPEYEVSIKLFSFPRIGNHGQLTTDAMAFLIQSGAKFHKQEIFR